MEHIREARFDDPDVQALIGLALAELSRRYGGSGDDTPVAPSDFAPPNGAFLVAEESGRLLGCAGWRTHGPDAELKRMFTIEQARGRGIARRVLAALEESARAAGRKRVILETGDKQPEAIALYEKCGYERIEDFGFYKGEPGVLSYAKVL
ncbi:GNAT family N-acetyltransferase [Actinoplanes sp. N902-109]|uniref:GNAT family N-acetyltransferase n=1 Tax=Actinoplanes sp. (strain N902-109) TaxID=649831 RepID=UPI00032966BB|nr:GNAT family N-acetyltransferase [Actinoplanes sp. N902-109]AGL20428.1 GCN5-like N-acetyltransferase [Actinoplanes sp. N902-109]